MNLLIDTHTLLWLFSNDDRLSQKALIAIENPNNNIFVSIAAFWEIAIKLSLFKLVLDIPFERLFSESDKMDIKILNINKQHLLCLKELPFIHRDPFDRIIISQSIVEDYTLVSVDRIFNQYKIKILW
ncbi:MAG: type II toxin-antitoxin system VapC family toxin [Desulfamplus sp.]|nr:type II toxin-antitoxin system VapC family toxin [Desulfamplus sp.]